ncbi:MAG: RusA family crossover junction endodeoxyribonuclease [Blastocatellia bacterium]
MQYKQFIFKLLPISKPRQTRSDKWKKRPCVLVYRAFADELRLQASRQGFSLENGLAYEFHLPMPKSWSQRKQLEKLGQLHDQKPDLDNLLKSVWDSLAKEDKAIAYIGQAKKVWSLTPKIIITKKIT